MILVFGSTGTVGGEVTRQLIAAGQKPRLLVRDPVKAKKFEGKAEIIKGDIGDAKILAEALKGADKVFLATAGVDGPELEARIIDAAKSAGVKHVVKLSLMGAESEAVAFGRWHRQSEKKLEASGLKWTFLRSGHFMSNALLWADDIKGQGTINLPAGVHPHGSSGPEHSGAGVDALDHRRQKNQLRRCGPRRRSGFDVEDGHAQGLRRRPHGGICPHQKRSDLDGHKHGGRGHGPPAHPI